MRSLLKTVDYVQSAGELGKVVQSGRSPARPTAYPVPPLRLVSLARFISIHYYAFVFRVVLDSCRRLLARTLAISGSALGIRCERRSQKTEKGGSALLPFRKEA